jgi:hypothetical protein
MKMVVVICHFQESLEWISKLSHPFVIYNKNPKNSHKYNNNLPNFGYDAIAYLRYIIDNYENLPDYVCFSQDNPFVHCPPFLEKVNNFKFDVDFLPLGVTYIRDNDNMINSAKKYATDNNIPVTPPIKFSSGMQYIISKKLILKNDTKFYKNLMSTLPTNSVKTETNYNLEYLWASVFHFNDNLKVARNGCA